MTDKEKINKSMNLRHSAKIHKYNYLECMRGHAYQREGNNIIKCYELIDKVDDKTGLLVTGELLFEIKISPKTSFFKNGATILMDDIYDLGVKTKEK